MQTLNILKGITVKSKAEEPEQVSRCFFIVSCESFMQTAELRVRYEFSVPESKEEKTYK